MRDNDWLNDVMEIDHVVRVNPDGTVDENPRRTHPGTPYAPEACIEADHDNQISAADESRWLERMEAEGWQAERGWTGQHGYRGALMHPSEYVGGALAEHVLSNPGLWVCVAVGCLRDDLTESNCAACDARIKLDPDADAWEDPDSAGGAEGRRHCPDATNSLHVPDHDPEKCGCARDEQESENAGWAILHMDDGPDSDSYVLRPSNGRPVPIRADLEGYPVTTLDQCRAQLPFWGIAHFAVPWIIRVTDLAIMPNEDDQP